MGKHLWRLSLIYLAFELMREIGGNVSNWVRKQPLLPWLSNRNDLIQTLGGFFIFLLYPLAAYILFELFYRKNRRRTLFYWLISITVIIATRYLVEQVLFFHLFGFRNYRGDVSLLYYYLDNLYYAFLYSAFGIIYFFLQSEHQHQLQQAELQLANKQTELSFLRSQINPHFLFNSLNNIYSLVYHQSDQSLTAIAKLSDLLRYMLYDANEKVPLQKELDYICKYMELQQMRFDKPLPINLVITGQPEQASIPPLLLIPFVENTFKHGDIQNGQEIDIHLYADAAMIRFNIRNAIGQQQKDSGGGIGLENVQRRLELLYPGHHQLQIRKTKDIFEAELQIRK